ncbi:uncharacterized protein [Oscarella lobularis]|uniref:uncharacterized protein n=1 Tax=Oscarella lobularis TaxID=121494 RepID=UPI003313C8A0
MQIPLWIVLLFCLVWLLATIFTLRLYDECNGRKTEEQDGRKRAFPLQNDQSALLPFGDDYNQMLTTMKIYVYDVRIGLEMKSPDDYKYGVEQLFIDLLQRSRFVTKSPAEASLFFIPTRCTAYRKSVRDRVEGGRVAARTVRRIVDWIKRTHPFWNSSLGVDHAYICSHDMGGECGQLADPNLHKNAVGLFNTADYADPWYIPHKDIALPPHPGRGVGSLSHTGRGGAGTKSVERTLLAFFAGNMKRGWVRQRVRSLFRDDPDITLIDGYLSDKEYRALLSKSKFCLCLRGNRVWSPRLMDCLWFGSVPVIIADYYDLPLADLIDWSSISVAVRESEIPHMKNLLLAIDAARLKQFQMKIQKVYIHLTWNDPPLPFDAFHSVLYQLWQRNAPQWKKNKQLL